MFFISTPIIISAAPIAILIPKLSEFEFIKSSLFLLFILVVGLYLAPMQEMLEGFKGNKRYKSDVLSVPGEFPRSVDKPILDDYPLTNSNGISNKNASDIWQDYPVFGVGSFDQITNNIRYNRNPDDGKCSRAEFCGALLKNLSIFPNIYSHYSINPYLIKCCPPSWI